MKREKRVSVRLSTEELETVRQKAESVGMDVSEYIRIRIVEQVKRVFYDPTMTAVMREVRDELRRICVCAGQVAAAAQGEDLSVTAAITEIKELLQEILSTVKNYEQILLSMRGG